MKSILIAFCSILICQYICQAQVTQPLPEPEMVLVEGGSFIMGLSTDSGGHGKGVTIRTHQVTLSSFRISKDEITQAGWQSVMGDSLNFSLNKGCAKCPVEEVSWNDIQLFIRALNAKTGKHYQLPTEAQWEFAARGGNKSRHFKYAGSDFIDEVAWPERYFVGETHPAGKKKPNELGLYDMTGNVAEWCNDWFDADADSAPQTDPQGPSSGRCHVIRGGGWGSNPSESDVNSFSTGFPNDRNARTGFRLVLAP